MTAPQRPRVPRRALDGVLLLDKPIGLSSNDALIRAKRLYLAKKAGHTGTLDPLATGLLPLCFGEATKFSQDLLEADKTYEATMRLGVRTTTGDAEGEPIDTRDVTCDPAAVQAAMQKFLGAIVQVPPMYSALKRAGQPLYKLARAGVEVEREARQIELFALRLLAFSAAAVELQAVCSKGMYVRTLAQDIAKALGTCGHVTALRRLYVEPFEGESMETLDSVADARQAGRWPRILPPDQPLGHLSALSLRLTDAARLLRGQAVTAPATGLPCRVRLYDEAGRFLGLGESDGLGNVQPRRLFVL